MADSIVTVVLKSTINWLLKKGGDSIAKKLTPRNGVVDQHHCESIVHELNKYDLDEISGNVADGTKRDFEEKVEKAKEELRKSIKLYSKGVRLISNSFEVPMFSTRWDHEASATCYFLANTFFNVLNSFTIKIRTQ